MKRPKVFSLTWNWNNFHLCNFFHFNFNFPCWPQNVMSAGAKFQFAVLLNFVSFLLSFPSHGGESTGKTYLLCKKLEQRFMTSTDRDRYDSVLAFPSSILRKPLTFRPNHSCSFSPHLKTNKTHHVTPLSVSFFFAKCSHKFSWNEDKTAKKIFFIHKNPAKLLFAVDENEQKTSEAKEKAKTILILLFCLLVEILLIPSLTWTAQRTWWIGFGEEI